MNEVDSMNEFIVRELFPSDKLGIDTLPEQLVNQRIEEDFVFNILFVGETGIGKSTLASSLFSIPLCAPAENHIISEVKLQSSTYLLSEKSVNVSLTVIETVGYGDQINGADSVAPIVNYIESQFETYFKEEMKMKRSKYLYKDARIHACLYFICPTGHNLKSLDIFCMKQLHDKVNLIPVIGKSDSLAPHELRRFKTAVRRTIAQQSIKIYHFPTDDVKIRDSNSISNDLIPFAIAASREFVPLEGKLTRARIFEWGTLLVENEEHCEFLALKRALIEVNMEDLREKTNDEFYEIYRETRLREIARNLPQKEPLTTLELFKNQWEKMHKEMLEEEEKLREMFAAKVKAKEEEFVAQEIALNSKYTTLFDQLKKEQNNLDLLKNELELEILAFKSEVKSKGEPVAKSRCKNS